MIDCLVPVWVWNIFDWIDGKELVTALNWMINNNIIFCNEVI